MEPIDTRTITLRERVIGGRVLGAQLRDHILADLAAAPVDALVAVDFASVQTLDFSAADELLSGLIMRVVSGELGSKRFFLVGLTDAVRESIAAVLDLRKRQCLEVRDDGAVAVLGPFSPPHRETFDYVTESGEVTVGDVARRFWPEPNMTAAANRLNALADSGLVHRALQPGGRRGTRLAYRSVLPRRSGLRFKDAASP